MLLLGLSYLHGLNIMHRVGNIFKLIKLLTCNWIADASESSSNLLYIYFACNKQHLRTYIQDIKPANLLINDECILKLADFGLSRLYVVDEIGSRPYSPQVASRWYRAPELLYGSEKYGNSIDIWASGCVFAEMIRGVPLCAVQYILIILSKNNFPELIDEIYFRVQLTSNNWHW